MTRGARDRSNAPVGRIWAIILAGGEGTRLSAFAATRYGEHRPKQYCSFLGERSMFEHTMERAIAVAGAPRIVSVIGRGHWRYLQTPRRTDVYGYVLEQPVNRDTAPGIFLPLTYVTAFDPDATVVILPSDHFVRPRQAFLDFMTRAAALAQRLDDRLVLAGAVADRPETEYGWIAPGRSLRDAREPEARAVGAFQEKPDDRRAEAFLGAGYLWNTFNMAARARAIWELGRRLQPEMIDRFEELREAIGGPTEAEALAAAYDGMPAVNFSRNILEKAPDQTAVLPMRGVEWCDWGRPERILETIARLQGPAYERAPLREALPEPASPARRAPQPAVVA